MASSLHPTDFSPQKVILQISLPSSVSSTSPSNNCSQSGRGGPVHVHEWQSPLSHVLQVSPSSSHEILSSRSSGFSVFGSFVASVLVDFFFPSLSAAFFTLATKEQ